MKRFFAFGLHIGDIGKRTHPKMDIWIPFLNVHLSQGTPTVRIVSYFGKSGNFVVDAKHDDPLVIAERLSQASERSFAVLPVENLHECLRRLKALNPPANEREFRPTLGASFKLGGNPILLTTEEIWETKNGHYFLFTPDIVGVWKKDRLALSPCSKPATTLESKQRDPWGVIGKDVASKLGGKWTSRSTRAIFGLIKREQQANRNSLE